MKKINDYNNTFGVWNVSTEGDCEGYTTQQLGIYKGYIDEIALMLGNKMFYQLSFTRVSDDSELTTTDFDYLPSKRFVRISLHANSDTWSMNSKERSEAMKILFKDRPVEINESSYFAAFELESKAPKITTFNVELDKIDLISLVKGTEPGYHVMGGIKDFGSYNGSHDRWDWNKSALSNLTEKQLYDLYLICKTYNL